MTYKKYIFSRFLINILVFLVVFSLFQSCKAYQDPITLEQAAISDDQAYMKITMVNGDEYIYEELEVVDGNYYGINTEKGEKLKTFLVKDKIKDVQLYNKKSSTFFKAMGITVGVASIYLAITMIGG